MRPKGGAFSGGDVGQTSPPIQSTSSCGTRSGSRDSIVPGRWIPSGHNAVFNAGKAGLFLRFADAGAGLLYNAVHDLPADAPLDIAEGAAVRGDHEGGGEGADAIGGKDVPSEVHHHRIGVAAVTEEGLHLLTGDVLVIGEIVSLGIGHPQDDHLPAVLTPVLIEGLDVGHLRLAGWAPGGPEIEKDGLALVVGQGVLHAVLVVQGKVGGRNRGRGGRGFRMDGGEAVTAGEDGLPAAGGVPAAPKRER